MKYCMYMFPWPQIGTQFWRKRCGSHWDPANLEISGLSRRNFTEPTIPHRWLMRQQQGQRSSASDRWAWVKVVHPLYICLVFFWIPDQQQWRGSSPWQDFAQSDGSFFQKAQLGLCQSERWNSWIVPYSNYHQLLSYPPIDINCHQLSSQLS